MPQARAIEQAAAHRHAAQSADGRIPSAPDQVAVHISHAIHSGESSVQIELHPADLGRVDVRLELASDGTATAHIVAERSDTLDLLRRDTATLERSLHDAGVRTESGGLSFSLRGDGQKGGQSERQTPYQASLNAAYAEDQQPASVRSYRLSWQGDAGLDISV